MTYGVTDNGFVKKDLSTIIEEINTEGRNAFGEDLNTDPEDSFFGVLTGIFGDRFSTLWDLAQSVYNSFYPNTAGGTSLDNVMAITAIKRLSRTKTIVPVKVYGTKTTEIPVTFTASIDGDSSKRFNPQSVQFIGDGTNEIQLISFSAIPTSGNFTLIFNGQETSNIAYSAIANDIKTALEGLSTISSVNVTGNFLDGFLVEFTGVDGEQEQLKISEGLTNTLQIAAVDIDISFSTTQTGDLPNVEFDMEAENAGDIVVLAGTLTVIDTPTFGIDSITNLVDGETGRGFETDAEARTRRIRTLQIAGNSTLDAIRSYLLTIDDVRSVSVFENTTDAIVSGRPPHSFEAVVDGGTDQEVGQAILDSKPAGIATTGNTSVVAQTSIGQSINVYFTRPSGLDIYCEVDLDTDNIAQKSIVNVGSVANDELYYIQVNSSVFQYTSDSSATEGEILSGLENEINLGEEFVEATIVGTDLEILSTRPGQAFTIATSTNLTSSTSVSNFNAEKFPTNGEDAVEEFILAYGDDLNISDDVLVWKLISSFSSIEGINSVTVRIGTSPSPTLSNNIAVSESQIAEFDSTRTTVKQV